MNIQRIGTPADRTQVIRSLVRKESLEVFSTVIDKIIYANSKIADRQFDLANQLVKGVEVVLENQKTHESLLKDVISRLDSPRATEAYDYFRTGQRMLVQKNYDAAINELTLAIQKFEHEYAFHVTIASIYHEVESHRNLGLAEKHYLLAATYCFDENDKPDSHKAFEAHYLLSRCCLEQGLLNPQKFRDSIQAAEKALKNIPDDDAHIVKTRALFGLGEPEKAVNYLLNELTFTMGNIEKIVHSRETHDFKEHLNRWIRLETKALKNDTIRTIGESHKRVHHYIKKHGEELAKPSALFDYVNLCARDFDPYDIIGFQKRVEEESERLSSELIQFESLVKGAELFASQSSEFILKSKQEEYLLPEIDTLELLVNENIPPQPTDDLDSQISKTILAASSYDDCINRIQQRWWPRADYSDISDTVLIFLCESLLADCSNFEDIVAVEDQLNRLFISIQDTASHLEQLDLIGVESIVESRFLYRLKIIKRSIRSFLIDVEKLEIADPVLGDSIIRLLKSFPDRLGEATSKLIDSSDGFQKRHEHRHTETLTREWQPKENQLKQMQRRIEKIEAKWSNCSDVRNFKLDFERDPEIKADILVKLIVA